MIDSLSLKETLDFHINGIVPVDKTRTIHSGNWFEKVYKNISDRLSSFFSASEDEVDSEKRSSSNVSTKTLSSIDSQKDEDIPVLTEKPLTREEVRELRAKKFFKKIFNLNEDDNNDDDEEEDEEE